MHHMNWKEFISSMTGVLIWPVLVVALLIVFRKPLGALFKPQEESDNWKAEFASNLKSAREQAERLSAPAPPPPDAQSPMRLQFEDDLPEAIVLLSFNDLLDAFSEAKRRLNSPKLPDDAPPLLVIRQLLYQHHPLPEQTATLFDSLKRARDAALRTTDKEPISRGEAIDFRTQAQKLASALREAIKDLPAQPAQSQ
jgi:hypothetical protein